MTSVFFSKPLNILSGTVNIEPNERITYRSIQLDFIPPFQFKARIAVKNTTNNINTVAYEDAKVKTRSFDPSVLKEKIQYLSAAEKESYFIQNFKIEVDKYNNQFTVILSPKIFALPQEQKSNFVQTADPINLNQLKEEKSFLTNTTDTIDWNQLKNELITEKYALIRTYANLVRASLPLQKQLFDLIDHSKNNAAAAVGAANAITILVAAHINLSNRNFKGIQIPYADLSYGILTNCDISYADLSYVRLCETVLDFSNLAHSLVKGIDFGKRACCKSENIWDHTQDGRFLLMDHHYPPLLLDTEKQLSRRLPVDKPYVRPVLAIFSPDEKQIAELLEDRIRFIDTSTLKTIKEINELDFRIYYIFYSPDGRFLILKGKNGEKKTLSILEIDSGKIIYTLEEKKVISEIKISKSGKQLLYSLDEKNGKLSSLFYLDLEKNDNIHCIEKEFEIGKISLSSDGKKVLFLEKKDACEYRLCVWDSDSKTIRFPTTFRTTINVAFSKDGNRVFVELSEKKSGFHNYHLINCDTFEEISTLKKNTDGNCQSLSLSEDNRTGIFRYQSHIELWDLLKQIKLLSIQIPHHHSAHFNDQFLGTEQHFKDIIQMSSNRRWLINRTYDHFKVWDLKRVNYLRDKLNSKQFLNQYRLNSIQFSGDGNKIVFHDSSSIYSLNSATSDVKVEKNFGKNVVDLVLFNKKMSALVRELTINDSSTSRIIDLETNQEINIEREIIALSEAGDVALVNVGKKWNEPKISLYHLQKNCDYPLLENIQISGKSISPDGKFALSVTIKVDSTQPGKNTFWDLSNNNTFWIHLFDTDVHKKRSFLTSNIGKKLIEETFTESFYPNNLPPCKFSKDSRWALVILSNIHIWSCLNPQKKYVIPVRACAVGFSPDNEMLIIGESNKKISLWDWKTNKKLLSFEWKFPVLDVQFFQDGQHILIVDSVSIQKWIIINDHSKYQAALIWTTVLPVLSTSNINLEHVKELSKNNKKLFEEGGATVPAHLNTIDDAGENDNTIEPYLLFDHIGEEPISDTNQIRQNRLDSHLSDTLAKHLDQSASNNNAIISPSLPSSKQNITSNNLETILYNEDITMRLAEAVIYNNNLTSSQQLISLQNNLDSLQKQMSHLDGIALEIVNGKAIELKNLIDQEQFRLKKEAIRNTIINHDILCDYYYVFVIHLSDVFMASKAIHSEMIENSSKNKTDYFTQFLDKGAEYVSLPGAALIKDVLTTGLNMWNDREKKIGVNRVSNFFINVTEADQFIEAFAMQLTISHESIVKALKVEKAGVLKKMASAIIELKNKMTANDIDNAIKELAAEHGKKMIKAIMDNQLSGHPSLQDIPQIIEKVFGITVQKQTLLSETFSTQSQCPSSFSIQANRETYSNVRIISASQPLFPTEENLKKELEKLAHEAEIHKKEMEELKEKMKRLHDDNKQNSSGLHLKIKKTIETVDKLESVFGTQILMPKPGEDNHAILKQVRKQEEQITYLTNKLLRIEEDLAISSSSSMETTQQKEKGEKIKESLFSND